MIRFLVRLSILLTIIFFPLALAASALGTSQPPNPALAGFIEDCQDKPQPCWYGIAPEFTKRREVTLLTESHDYHMQTEIYSGSLRVYSTFRRTLPSSGCQLDVGYGLQGEVVDFRLHDCQGIYLGDIIQLFGMDTHIGFDQPGIPTLIYTKPEFQIHFLFSGTPRPFRQVDGVEIYLTIVPFTTFAWHGFAPPQRYCQLEPHNPDCKNA
jgi:hypothetical protein